METEIKWARHAAPATAAGDGAAPDYVWPDGGCSRIPFWVYTDEAIYRREQERIFRGPNWAYVALECEIPNPGDFKRSFVGDLPIVVVRDTDGSVNAFANSCAHRGVAFCQSEHGNAKSFTCPYHHWSYDLKGNVTGLPFRRGYKGKGGMPKDFELGQHRAQPLVVNVRNGAIFASFDASVESFEDYLGPRMLGYYDRVFDGRKLELLGYMRQRIDGNWKFMFENLKDPYHASLLHVFFVTFGLFRMDAESAIEMDETGRHCAMINRRGGKLDEVAAHEMRQTLRSDMQLKDTRVLDLIREFPGDVTAVMCTFWPNLIIQQQSNTLAMRHLVPRGPDSHDLHWTFFGYADDTPEMRAHRIRQANLMGPAGFVSVDDSEVMVMSQEGVTPYNDRAGVAEMAGRTVENHDHTITEVAVRGLYQHYRKVMGL
ncbi:aromatic ring-hydroxylating dioxygenase subunit alpha [Burkholderia sp. Ac-20365]|uniref:aromatic ring-hydroxylating dioxygenase subunit alpha n=1 Tax=Burkholderia sp. Ac-20365 TaxID=2703897 RepID=UPI003217B990